MKSIGILVVLLALSLTSPALAGDHGDGHRGDGKGCLYSQLELTDEQKAEIDALKEAKHADKEALHDQAKSLAGEMEALWAAESLDREAVLAKAEEIQEIKAQMHLRKLEYKLDFLDVLTDEQRAIAQAHYAEKMGKEHGHGDHHKKGCSCGKGGEHGEKGCHCDKGGEHAEGECKCGKGECSCGKGGEKAECTKCKGECNCKKG